MARSFFITRALTDSEDPTTLEFFPPKGSDELHEALKEAFPSQSTLSARMRAAVIEFLLQEQQAEQFTPSSTEYLPSPQSTFISTMPSPSLSLLRTPQDASPSRTEFTGVGLPSQQALMDVWSLPNKPQAKVHTRRTMTSEEKKAYKQKRLVGACADCKRRRRKCDHNFTGGSNIVPQKVGKHKKRVTTSTPACKPDTMADFSFDTPAFNFDEAMGSIAMPVDLNLSLDLDLGLVDFGSFSPDLSDDWQLFPDLPIVNGDYTNAWTSDQQLHDYSLFRPQVGMSQSQVSTSSSAQHMLSQSMNSQRQLSSSHTDTEPFGTPAWGASGTGNLPISPAISETPQLGSSRTHSGIDGLYNQANIGLANYISMGAPIDQPHVSLNKPMQAPIPTDELRYPTPVTQPVDTSLALEQQQESCARSSTTSRSSKPPFSRPRTSDPSVLHAIDADIGQIYDCGRLKDSAQHSPTLNRTVQTSSGYSHAEASLSIQKPLQGRPLVTSFSTQATRADSRSITSGTIAERQVASAWSLSISPTSIMSRPRPTSQEDHLPRDLTIEVATSDGTSQPPAQHRRATNAAPLQGLVDIHGDDSSVEAPLCFALCAAYCAMVQSAGGLAVLAMVIFGVCVLLDATATFAGKQRLASTWWNALRSCTKPSRALSFEPGPKSTRTEAAGPRSSRSSPAWTKFLTLHLGLLGAPAIA